jgi:hypothetical protein
MQNPNFAWGSCSNHREKHRMDFANVVEGRLIYNFRIYRFYRTVQLFGETRSRSCIDWLKCCSAALQSAVGAPGALLVWPRRASRTGSHTCLGVRAGSFPTASRSGPPVPLRADLLGTHAASSYRIVLPSRFVSVRNVVLTLTSNKRQGLSLNGRC